MEKIDNAPFSPRSVDLSKNLLNTFGKFEVEQDVIRIIKYFSAKNYWRPISRTWLEERIGSFEDYIFETANGYQEMDFLEYLKRNGYMRIRNGWYYPNDHFFFELSKHLKLKKWSTKKTGQNAILFFKLFNFRLFMFLFFQKWHLQVLFGLYILFQHQPEFHGQIL